MEIIYKVEKLLKRLESIIEKMSIVQKFKPSLIDECRELITELKMMIEEMLEEVSKLSEASKKYSQFAKLRKYPKILRRLDEGSEYISEEEEKKYMQKAIELPLERKGV